jgi:hypothetical protein
VRNAACGTRNKPRDTAAAGWNSLVDRIHGTGGDSQATPPISTHLRPIRGESFFPAGVNDVLREKFANDQKSLDKI